MKLTLTGIGNFPTLHDDQGRRWNPFDDSPDYEHMDYTTTRCGECEQPIFRGYHHRIDKWNYRFICPDCVELDIPASVIGSGQ